MESLPPSLRLALASFAYAVAYGAGIAIFVWAMRRRGFEPRTISALAVAGLLGGGFGAIVVQATIAGEPGRTLLGGVAGGWLAVLAAKRSLGVTRSVGDAFAYAIAAGEAIGRLGCFAFGCCYGKIANVPWAVVDHGAPRHPTQLYSAFAALVTLGVLVWLERNRRLPEGALFCVQGTLLCAFRFVIEFYREGSAYGALSIAQYACIAGVAFFAWRLRAVFMPAAALA